MSNEQEKTMAEVRFSVGTLVCRDHGVLSYDEWRKEQKALREPVNRLEWLRYYEMATGQYELLEEQDTQYPHYGELDAEVSKETPVSRLWLARETTTGVRRWLVPSFCSPAEVRRK